MQSFPLLAACSRIRFPAIAAAVAISLCCESRAVEIADDGMITIEASEASVEGDTFAVTFKATRWGMYSLVVELDCPDLKAVRTIDGLIEVQADRRAEPVAIAPGRASGHAMLGIPRVYIARGGECPVRLTLPGFSDKIRCLTFKPVREGTANLGSNVEGVAELGAGEARVVGKRLRYEPNPKKLCLGYWGNAADYAVWPDVVVEAPDSYEITVYQGCGTGQGGSEAEVVVTIGQEFEKRFPFEVIDTGGFQKFVPVKVGTVDVPASEPAGRISVEIRAKKLAKNAVMDVQKIVLRKIKAIAGDGR